jgi:hypothetical protein
MCLKNGSLFCNGKDGGDAAGQDLECQIATMELDTDAHTLNFWVDGKPHGPGFTNRVAGSLRWALSINGVYAPLYLVPTEDSIFEDCYSKFIIIKHKTESSISTNLVEIHACHWSHMPFTLCLR